MRLQPNESSFEGLAQYRETHTDNSNTVWNRRRLGDKPLSEPMRTRFTDAYVRH